MILFYEKIHFQINIMRIEPRCHPKRLQLNDSILNVVVRDGGISIGHIATHRAELKLSTHAIHALFVINTVIVSIGSDAFQWNQID